MKPDYIFWVAMAAYAFHLVEEYNYDFVTYSQKVLKLDMDWTNFYVTNLAMLFLGIACAAVGWAHPTFSLIFPAFIVINSIFYHVLPYVRSNRKFSPGMFTAILLFLPIGLGSFKMAVDLGVQPKSMLLAVLGGAIVSAFPVFLLKTKDLDFFKP